MTFLVVSCSFIYALRFQEAFGCIQASDHVTLLLNTCHCFWSQVLSVRSPAFRDLMLICFSRPGSGHGNSKRSQRPNPRHSPRCARCCAPSPAPGSQTPAAYRVLEPGQGGALSDLVSQRGSCLGSFCRTCQNIQPLGHPPTHILSSTSKSHSQRFPRLQSQPSLCKSPFVLQSWSHGLPSPLAGMPLWASGSRCLSVPWLARISFRVPLWLLNLSWWSFPVRSLAKGSRLPCSPAPRHGACAPGSACGPREPGPGVCPGLGRFAAPHIVPSCHPGAAGVESQLFLSDPPRASNTRGRHVEQHFPKCVSRSSSHRMSLSPNKPLM